MSALHRRLDTALRLLFRGHADVVRDSGMGPRAIEILSSPELSSVEDLQRVLGALGLQLAIVPTSAPALQIPDRDVLLAAIERALAAGQPEQGLQARFARLLGRDRAAVSRVLEYGAELDGEARGRLHAHMLDPGANGLPDPTPMGRPKKSTDP